ncbi:MAG: NAD(P)/FAD-dependent oxidoreductase, partial [Gemmatimonas sp.]
MSDSADVVVIGGGIMGVSTAYHLAARGCRNVTVLESGEMFGLGSTGLNAGGVRHQFSTAVNIELSKLSIGMMERFADEMGQEVGLRRCGYLFLLDADVDLRRFRDNVELQNQHGIPSQVLSTDAIGALVPEVDLTGIIGGTWCALDGLVDPHGLLQGYITRARGLGVTLRTRALAT